MTQVKILLTRSTSFFSKLIQWQTRSKYAHASIIIDETLYEAREFKGVLKRKATQDDYENGDCFLVRGTTFFSLETLIMFLEKQVGKKYDYMMVLRFVSRRQETRKSRNKWFCSELVFAALRQAGFEILKKTEPFEVSPGLLSRSPDFIQFSRSKK